MALVLLVEDERAIAESLEFALRRDGFQVVCAGTLAAAQAALGDCDLLVLDLMLPDGSGFDLLRDLRESGLRTPVIILSSREEEADRVAGLEGGADDYVIKPFSPREVVARVRAVLRRFASVGKVKIVAARCHQASGEVEWLPIRPLPTDLRHQTAILPTFPKVSARKSRRTVSGQKPRPWIRPKSSGRLVHIT
mgnify:CR=1 FL=1